MKKFNYHESELEKLELRDLEYNTSVKFWSGYGQNTKQMDLTLESLPVFIDFLKNLETKLKEKTNVNK